MVEIWVIWNPLHGCCNSVRTGNFHIELSIKQICATRGSNNPFYLYLFIYLF